MNTRAKLGLLGALYLSQGLPFGFFVQTLPVLMRDAGYSLSMIGLGSLLGMPWSLKFLWAPMVDRVGRRKTWIIPLQLTAAALMAAMAFAPPDDHGMLLVFVGFFFASLIAATQDIATDGLAVETLEPHERGLGNGVQVAGYRVGMILGGGVILILFDQLGWTGSFLAMSAILLVSSIPILLHDEPERPHIERPETDRAVIASYLKTPGVRQWLVILVAYKSGEALATGMLRPFLKDLGMTLADIGWLLGTFGFVAGLLGALIGGYIASQVSRRTALVSIGCVMTLSVALYLLPALGFTSFALLAVVIVIEHLASGAATAALFTAMMDRCRPGNAGTDYTIQASAVVIATGSMSVVSGFVADALGYVGHYLLGTLACGLAVLVVARLRAIDAAMPESL